MLVLANGAPKTGSTWLWGIIASMMEFNDVPEKYQNKAWGKIGSKRSIAPKKISSFLTEVDYINRNYISKNHLHSSKDLDLILKHSDCSILCISRDLKDVVVSYYFHQIRKGNLKCDFFSFYWRYGRYFIQYMVEYQRVWHIKHPRIFVSSFERLKTDFNNECKEIGMFLGIDFKDIDILNIKKATSIENMRRKWGEEGKSESQKFFRKGIVGDWKNHFDDPMIRDYEQILENGLKNLDWLRYYIMYPLRLNVLKEYQYLTN